MIREIIDKAIKTEEYVEMEYSKDGVSNKFFQLCNIRYSDDFGDRCICGCPVNSDKELTFNMDRISDIRLMWNNVNRENVQFDKGGIYALAILGDNYIDLALHSFDAGEKVKDHCTFDLIDILAYHYIPFFSEANSNEWLPFNKTLKVQYEAVYVFAYTLEDGVSVELWKRDDFLLCGYRYRTTEHAGIHYTAMVVRKGDSFDQIEINEGINILGYSRCCRY